MKPLDLSFRSVEYILALLAFQMKHTAIILLIAPLVFSIPGVIFVEGNALVILRLHVFLNQNAVKLQYQHVQHRLVVDLVYLIQDVDGAHRKIFVLSSPQFLLLVGYKILGLLLVLVVRVTQDGSRMLLVPLIARMLIL